MKLKLSKSVNVDFELTTEDIADAFSNSDSLHQAKFFNRIAENIKDWECKDFRFQAQFISDEDILTDEARELMKVIGRYHKKKTKSLNK